MRAEACIWIFSLKDSFTEIISHDLSLVRRECNGSFHQPRYYRSVVMWSSLGKWRQSTHEVGRVNITRGWGKTLFRRISSCGVLSSLPTTGWGLRKSHSFLICHTSDWRYLVLIIYIGIEFPHAFYNIYRYYGNLLLYIGIIVSLPLQLKQQHPPSWDKALLQWHSISDWNAIAKDDT